MNNINICQLKGLISNPVWIGCIYILFDIQQVQIYSKQYSGPKIIQWDLIKTTQTKCA